MITGYERRYYDDINSLAQCMPEILKMLELLVKKQKTVVENKEASNHLPQQSVKTHKEQGYEKCNCGKELGMPDSWVCDVCEIGKRNRARNQAIEEGKMKDPKEDWDWMHSRPINWNPGEEDDIDLAIVFTTDEDRIVVTPICPRCNYRYTADTKNYKDWNCEWCGHTWQTHQRFSDICSGVNERCDNCGVGT